MDVMTRVQTYNSSFKYLLLAGFERFVVSDPDCEPITKVTNYESFE